MILAIGIIIMLGLTFVAFSPRVAIALENQKKQVTITAILDDQGDPPRLLKMLFQPAIKQLEARHKDLEVKLDYRPVPYLNLHDQILKSMANQTPVDILTVDHIWLGEFAEKGYLMDLTNLTKSWGRSADWYEGNWDGGVYNDKVYGIWTVVDVRGLWYWKDMLDKAGVDPNSMKTWNGYIEGAKKLNAILRPEGIEGVHLVGASHSPDIDFYPYLWMLGGDIIGLKSGHPSKGSYWFPTFNNSEGVRALGFIKAQLDAGIKPQKNHYWGKEFLDRKFAVMLEALQNHVHVNTTGQKQEFEHKVGFLPMFPVPDGTNRSATMMGGWEFSVTNKSKNKDLAWELVTIMEDPKIITPFFEKYGLLPTQVPIGNGEFSANLSRTIPYYDQLISMLQLKGVRPNIPEYPQIADNLRQALDEVLYQSKQPKQALDEAAAKSAKALGW
ncbi:MAG TPA: extracellular solute-binding protein [Nitrososphaeraceae archaeon]